MSEAKSEAKATESKTDDAKGIKIVVAVDGSEIAHRCFLAAVHFKKPEDHITVLHVYDPAKDYVPGDLKPKALLERYETECIGRWTKTHYNLEFHRKKAGEATRKAVCDFVNSDDFDLLAVGMVGRKGPKEKPHILGSTADYSLRGAHLSSLIVKSTKELPKRATYMVGVDGSDAAHAGYEFCVAQSEPGDKIMAVHVVNPLIQAECNPTEKASNVSAKYTDIVMKDSRASYHAVPVEPGTSVSDTFCNFAFDSDATFLCIGADGCGAYAKGHTSYRLGSVSDMVVKYSRVNLIVHQQGGKVYS